MSYNKKQYLQSLTKNQQLEIMKVDFFSDRKLQVIEEENAYILPAIHDDETSWYKGGVITHNLNYINESGQYAYGENNRVYGSYDFNRHKVKYNDYEVIYLNYYISQWGHYLLDVIGRLWFLSKNTNCKIAYTTTLQGNNHIKNNFLQLLRLLGIKEDRLLFINEVTKFKKVIIPETSILVAKYWTNEYKQIIDKLVDNALEGYKLKRNRKIYCSRKHFSEIRSLSFGESQIEDIFKNNGYEIVYMEELDLISQIRLLNECKEVVCAAGTLVHNAMFVRNNKCNFVVLNKTYKINPNIYFTNQLSRAKFTFIDIYLSPLPVSIGKGPFMFTITNELIEYFKDNNFVLENINTKIDTPILLKYYVEYFKKYRKKIFKGKQISTSGFVQYDVSYNQIRQHYKKQLELLNK